MRTGATKTRISGTGSVDSVLHIETSVRCKRQPSSPSTQFAPSAHSLGSTNTTARSYRQAFCRSRPIEKRVRFHILLSIRDPSSIISSLNLIRVWGSVIDVSCQITCRHRRNVIDMSISRYCTMGISLPCVGRCCRNATVPTVAT